MAVSKIIELCGAVHVLGKAEFRVLEGSVFVNGRSVSSASDDKMSLFSPRSSALLEMEPTSPAVKIEFTELANGLEAIQTCQPNFGDIFAPEPETADSFEEVVPGLFFLRTAGDSGNVAVMRITEEWREVLRDVGDALDAPEAPDAPDALEAGLSKNEESPAVATRRPVILVCGHRKVGKSSFSRFLLNGLLNDCPAVDFVDLDPGQTEFTPAGFVARKRFCQRDALLGPPFTHLMVPDDSVYLAASSVNDSPFLYCRAMDTIKRNSLLPAPAAAFPPVPMIINTMGWMTGLGLDLIQYALHVFKPSHVLAFMTPENEDTIRKCMTTTNALGGASSEMSQKEAEGIYVRYMGNPTNDGPRGKHSPADQRNLAYWSYFFGSHPSPSSPMITTFNFNRQLSEIRPLVISLSYVQLASTAAEIDLFALLSSRSRPDQMKLLESWMLMRLVGLARDDKFRNYQGRWVNILAKSKRVAEMPCIGLGLIRSIVPCPDGRVHLHVITPLPLSQLSSTNTLILGIQQLPIPMLSADSISMKAEAPGFSTQMVGTDVAGAGARKTRHNMRRK